MRFRKGRSPRDRGSGSLNILFVAGCWYPHEEQPFQGIFIRRHAEAVALRHRVTVLHPFLLSGGPRRPEVDWQESGRVRELHVRLRDLRDGLAGKWRNQAGFFRAGKRGCDEVLRVVGRPDIIHFHVVPSFGLTAAVLLAFPRTPVVLTEHWSGYLPESGVRLSLVRRLYTGLMARQACVVTTVSERHREAMLELGFKGRFKIVPNVVDVGVFEIGERSTVGPFRFVHVSGLRQEKNVEAIVLAMGRVLQKTPETELHIVGDGPHRSSAEAVAEGLGVLGRSVFFHGMLETEGVAAVLRRCDALVLFSDFENSPCVVSEAMACGLFVVAPDVGGIPEHVIPERGMLVPPGDADALSLAMAELVRRGRTWDSEAIRSHAVMRFSREVIGRLFNDVYSQSLWPKRC